ncbi:MAG: pilin [Patescibacteria group bacterium]
MKKILSRVGALFLGALSIGMVMFPRMVSAALREAQPVYGKDQATINLETLTTWVENIATFLLYIGGVVAVIFLLWGGITYMMAGGDPEKADKAKTRLLNGVIGALIVLGVGVILNTIVYFITKGVTY